MVTLYHYNFYTQYHEYARAVLADAVVLVPTGYETVVIITVVIVIVIITIITIKTIKDNTNFNNNNNNNNNDNVFYKIDFY